MAEFPALDDPVENQRLQFLCDLRSVDVDRLDLLFDVLFFIGQVLVQLAIALDVGVLLQQTERLLDPPLCFVRSVSNLSSIRIAMLRAVALNSLTYLTRNRAFRPASRTRHRGSSRRSGWTAGRSI